MINSFILTRKHSKFLNEERKDPITQDSLEINDEIVFCAECKSAYLKDTWLFKNEECCNQKYTLSEFPISQPLNLATKTRLSAIKETKKSDELEIKGYFFYGLFTFQIIFTIVIAVLFSDIQPSIPTIYNIFYVIIFEVIMLLVCYKKVKTYKLSEKIIIYFGTMFMTLTMSMININVLLIDILSDKRSNKYAVECIKTGKIYNKKYGGHSVGLKMSESSLLSIYHDINGTEKRMIENSSCTCVELKLYKSSTGIYYIKNRDAGIVKECEE